jgi:CBS domain containing-hemolysin-like protein
MANGSSGGLRGHDLVGEGIVTGARLEPPAALVSPDSTLRAAMDRIMTARTAVAVVVDEGRFLGLVTLEDIRRALADGAV